MRTVLTALLLCLAAASCCLGWLIPIRRYSWKPPPLGDVLDSDAVLFSALMALGSVALAGLGALVNRAGFERSMGIMYAVLSIVVVLDAIRLVIVIPHYSG